MLKLKISSVSTLLIASLGLTLGGCSNGAKGVSLNRPGQAPGTAATAEKSPFKAASTAVASDAAVGPSGPKVLIVVAHPDDEYCFAATVYRITHELGGVVDQVVVTNGEGGYKYSKVAEPIYGVPLTKEVVGRANLPSIRESELLAAGKILGVRDHVLIRKADFGYTTDAETPMKTWGRDEVVKVVSDALGRDHYDFVFTHLPVPGAHGHHKAATSMALEAVSKMSGDRPVVLGCYDDTVRTLPSPTLGKADCDKAGAANCDDYNASIAKTEFETMKGQVKDLAEVMRMKDQAADIRESKEFVELEHHPETRILENSKTYSFDRNAKFGFKSRQDYQVYVNWMISEHKSQGYFQTYFFRDDSENFRLYAQNPADAVAKTDALFKLLTP